MSPPTSAPVNARQSCGTCLTPCHTLLCHYVGKKCRNVRATKRNGALHTLCDHHRVRANQNQRRMSQRARMRRAHAESEPLAQIHPAHSQSATLSEVSTPNTQQWEQLLRTEASVPPSPPQELLREDTSPSDALVGNPVLLDIHFVEEFQWAELLGMAPLGPSSHVWSDYEVFAAMRSAGSEVQISAWSERESVGRSRVAR